MMDKTRLLNWLVFGILLLTWWLALSKGLKHQTEGLVNDALTKVSADVNDLSTSLVGFESDLKNLQDQVNNLPPTSPVVGKSTVATSQTAAAMPAPSNPSNNQGLININTASLSELTSLPGIGATYGQRIIEARPFSSIAELTKVKGIGPKTLEKISAQITVQ